MVKNNEVEVLQKVLSVFEEKLPQETELLQEFRTVFESMVERKNRQSYFNKADYYKDAVREWKSKNPEKSKEYSKRHLEKKRTERKEKVLYMNNQGKTVSEIAKELKISEKTVMLCLNEVQN